MSNEERSQIVKRRWQTISDKQKSIYVALARLEEEQEEWAKRLDFYKERIDTMRDHANMEPLKESFWKLERKDDEESDDSSADEQSCQLKEEKVRDRKEANLKKSQIKGLGGGGDDFTPDNSNLQQSTTPSQ